jgi:hypothetical protein
MVETIKLWHVTSPYKSNHESGYYDMGIYSKIELAVAAAETLLFWLVGRKAGNAQWKASPDGSQVLIYRGMYGEDIYIGVTPRIVDTRPSTLEEAEHTVYT